VWIVNPFDPLPGDPEPPGRYASLARVLRDAGYGVTWWTASFSHRYKSPLDQGPLLDACRREGIEVRFVETPRYERNVSLSRFRSHRVFADGFSRASSAFAAPAVIVASNPPMESAAAAGRVARDLGARLIVDVQDIWIESSRRFLPSLIRWAWPLLFRPWIRANREAFAAADAVVGVARDYANQASLYGRGACRQEVIPLGIDLAAFDAAAASGRSLLPARTEGQVRVIYSGSLSRNYDVLTAARAARRAVGAHPHLEVIFNGRGELVSELRPMIEGVPGIRFLDFVGAADWAATVKACDIGWNAVRPESRILFPNKVFGYWAAGLAVLNTIPGECAEWIARTETGVTYAAGDEEAACRALAELAADPAKLASMRAAARASAVERWDRKHLYRAYLSLVESLADSARPC